MYCYYTCTVLSQCPRFHELDLIRGNQKTVRVLEGSASKWDGIARRIYFSGNMISQIRTESQNDALRACQSVFTQWLEGKEGLRMPRTWNTVIDVLKEAHLGQLADDLTEVLRGKRQKYSENTNVLTIGIMQLQVHIYVLCIQPEVCQLLPILQHFHC